MSEETMTYSEAMESLREQAREERRHRSPRRFLGANPEDWAAWDQAAQESGEKNWADWARRVLRAAALTNR